MPSKKKKYNARFPAGRIKKIMQTDEEVGKVAQAVPVIISRTLELFVESLLTKTLRITNARNAKTLSPSHMKQCIISESRFDFLRDLVKNIPDIGVNEEQLSGSETGNETAAPSPASTSTSSSSNGGSSVASTATSVHAGEHAAGTSSSGLVFQRSESYTPAGSNYARILPIQVTTQHNPPSQSQSTSNSLKRTLNHVGFYKEISLEETSGSSSSGRANREPPPKLTRLHSAPASATATTTNSVPFKIDILPGLPVTASSTGTTGSNSSQPPLRGAAGSGNFKILCSYKIDAAPITPVPVSTSVNLHQQQSVIKLDYSNLKLPMTVVAADTQSKPQQHSSRHPPQQPTIKIDLSSITNFSSTPSPLLGSKTSAPGSNHNPSVISIKQVPLSASAPSTPSTPLSAASSSSGMSSSGSSSRNPYVFQPSAMTSAASANVSTSSSSSSPATPVQTAPIYSSVSSTIPGMDEDYDDI